MREVFRLYKSYRDGGVDMRIGCRLIQGWKRSEILIINTIRKSDFIVLEYRPEGSQSRWSSAVVTDIAKQNAGKSTLEQILGLHIEMKTRDES